MKHGVEQPGAAGRLPLPRQTKRGHDAVIDDCLALLAGDTEPHRAQALAGTRWAVYIDEHSSDLRYWLRVWALRGLLWEWDPRASDAVRDAMVDPAWRVPPRPRRCRTRDPELDRRWRLTARPATPG